MSIFDHGNGAGRWRNGKLEAQATIAKQNGIAAIQRFRKAVTDAELDHVLPAERDLAGSYRAIARHYGLTIPEGGAITEWTERLCKLMEKRS